MVALSAILASTNQRSSWYAFMDRLSIRYSNLTYKSEDWSALGI